MNDPHLSKVTPGPFRGKTVLLFLVLAMAANWMGWTESAIFFLIGTIAFVMAEIYQ